MNVPKHKHGGKKKQAKYERVVAALKKEGVQGNPYAIANAAVYGRKLKKRKK